MANKPKSKTAEHLINEHLKQVYSSVADEELPDRFKDLLAQLKQSTGKADDENSETGDSK